MIHDPAHWLVLTIGAGGIHTEILRDTVHLLVPAPRDEVDAALGRLALAPLLTGYRGNPPIDRAALLDTIEALQDFVTSHAGRIEEVEINPLICTSADALVADALIRMEMP